MTDKAEFERLLDVYGFRCERFGQDLSTHARAQVVSAFAALASAPVTGLPERDATKAAEDQGLFRKFDVRRTDGSDQPGGKHHGCRYFVLDVDHDPHASAALGAYAAACERTHPALASDLREKWGAPLAGEATDGRQALLEAIHRYGNARAMAEHNIAYRDEVRNTADALLALFDAAPQASECECSRKSKAVSDSEAQL